jgi:hypothetical protein
MNAHRICVCCKPNYSTLILLCMVYICRNSTKIYQFKIHYINLHMYMQCWINAVVVLPIFYTGISLWTYSTVYIWWACEVSVKPSLGNFWIVPVLSESHTGIYKVWGFHCSDDSYNTVQLEDVYQYFGGTYCIHYQGNMVLQRTGPHLPNYTAPWIQETKIWILKDCSVTNLWPLSTSEVQQNQSK